MSVEGKGDKLAAPKESDSPLWVFKTSDRKPIALDSEGLMFVFEGKMLCIYTEELIGVLREQLKEQLAKDPPKEYRYKIYGGPLFPQPEE